MTADAASVEDQDAMPTSSGGLFEPEAVFEADVDEEGADDALLDGYLPL